MRIGAQLLADDVASRCRQGKAKRLLRKTAAAAPAILCILAGSQCVQAQTIQPILVLESLRESQGIIGLSFCVGLVLFSAITALVHLTERRRWTKAEAAASLELNNLRAKLDRAGVFLAAEPQIIIAWGGTSDKPELEGDLTLVSAAPIPRRVLAFGAWLPASIAQNLDECVDKLRARGESFRLSAESLNGRHFEIDGRAISGRAVMRIRDVSGDRLEAVRLRELLARRLSELDAFRAMLDAVADPAWMRDADGKLAWVNAAYTRAVEAKDATDAAQRGIELLERTTREASAQKRAEGAAWRGRAPAIVAGSRRTLDIVDVPVETGSIGIARDVSELEAVRADLERQMQGHARTLDQLSTAVAIFNRTKRLVFHNAAYRQLWSLDQAFVDQHPSDSEILDRLRVARLLPEQADFRSWKESLFSAYQALETAEHVWYLPGGRTLRVVINPNPQGGVTYLFDDVTERFHLESMFNALTYVQSETLDTLKEGVAVFGTDGRLKFFNPAFADLWKIPAAAFSDRPHIDRVAGLCAARCAGEQAFDEIRAIVVGLTDQRTGFETRLNCIDGSVLDCTAQPLPDGATLLTFTDTTASVNVERALKERNQALVDAEKLRNDFVHHVSYELRSPLTTIIGFTEMLTDGSAGPLNSKQTEYAGHVMKSSRALLAIINDILDLASIDADALQLTLEEVDIKETISFCAEAVQDRLAESAIDLQVVAMDGLDSFIADGMRIRQILFNLLTNAIDYSEPGRTITLAALRRDEEIVFKVTDQGRGIPSEVLSRVFDRFNSYEGGTRHRGVGIGLSIVRSFVELHGGRVLIDSVPGEGTTVTCIFPVRNATVPDVQPAGSAAWQG
jgi:signal transduction histidine kinase